MSYFTCKQDVTLPKSYFPGGRYRFTRNQLGKMDSMAKLFGPVVKFKAEGSEARKGKPCYHELEGFCVCSGKLRTDGFLRLSIVDSRRFNKRNSISETHDHDLTNGIESIRIQFEI